MVRYAPTQNELLVKMLTRIAVIIPHNPYEFPPLHSLVMSRDKLIESVGKYWHMYERTLRHCVSCQIAANNYRKHPLFITEPTRGAHSLILVGKAFKHVDHRSNETEKAEIGWGLIILIHFIFIWIFLNNCQEKKKNFATVIHLNWLKNKIDSIFVQLQLMNGLKCHIF